MPIESPFLQDWFERDWANAMAQYEARKADPRSSPWTGAPGPDSDAALRAELIDPLYNEYAAILGPRTGTRGGWTSPMNVGGGEVLQFDPVTGARRVLNAPRPDTATPTRTGTSQRESPDVTMARRRVENARRALLGAKVKRQQDTAQAELDAALRDLTTLLQPVAQPGNQQNWFVDPNTIPYGSPGDNIVGTRTRNVFGTGEMFQPEPLGIPAPAAVSTPQQPAIVPYANERNLGDILGANYPAAYPTGAVQMTPPVFAPTNAGPNVKRSLRVLSIEPAR